MARLAIAVTSEDIISVGVGVFEGFPFMNGSLVSPGGKKGPFTSQGVLFQAINCGAACEACFCLSVKHFIFDGSVLSGFYGWSELNFSLF